MSLSNGEDRFAEAAGGKQGQATELPLGSTLEECPRR